MRSRDRVYVITIVLILFQTTLFAQKSDSLLQLPFSYFDQVSSKAISLEQELDRKSEKVLEQLARQEQKINRKLAKVDSLAAKNLFANSAEKYKELQDRLAHASKLKQYIPFLDSVHTSLNFLNQNPEFLSSAKEVQKKAKEALAKLNAMEDKLQKAEEIKQFLRERKQFLKEQLSKFGITKELKKINKQVYYYSQQVNEYKSILKDPKRIERKAIELLSKTKFFQEFMQKNSMLASLFRFPGNPNDPISQVSLAGLQTRVQVNQLIQGQIASGGPNAAQQVQQTIQQAQAQLQQLKNKINQFGGNGNDIDIPDFKPNSQKTKSFSKRLEYAFNIQSQKTTYFFPATSDIGLSLGYKLNDKSVFGIGASYKIGWGRSWDNISISHQGVGLRSFIDWKLKKNFFISGGYEQNYKAQFRRIDQLRDYSSWQQSGLLGLSKTLSVKSKLIKKTKLQLLWDFLSYQQIPKTQPILFRIGYNLK
jgi:hypothetical protein